MNNNFILLVDDNPDCEPMLDALRSPGVKAEIAVARDRAEVLDFLFLPNPEMTSHDNRSLHY